MPRIRPADRKEGGLLLRYLNRKARRGFGQEPLPPRVLARNPRFVPAYFFMSRRFLGAKTELDPAIRQLALQVISTHNGCSWCADFGAAKALRLGVSTEKLWSVLNFETSPAYSERERAALAFAWQVALNRGRVSEAVFAEVKKNFSEREVVELTAALAAETFFNHFNNALEIHSQGFSKVIGTPHDSASPAEDPA
jgi:AhpD family alkylhydroperoxidase